MKVLLFSDLHYSLTRTIHGRQPATVLREAIGHANAGHADARLCIVLGDLTDRGAVSEYRGLAQDLEALSSPYRLLLGNHDDRGGFARVFGAGTLDANGYVQSFLDLGGCRFILLDTHVAGAPWGSLDGGRLDWLDSVLSDADGPCVVCMHHPPLPTALPAFDAAGLRDAPRLGALLGRYRSTVRMVLCGHCHMSIGGSLAGIPVCGMKSLLYQALPNFRDARFVDAPDLPPAYGVAMIEETTVTVHLEEFGYRGAVATSGEEP